MICKLSESCGTDCIGSLCIGSKRQSPELLTGYFLLRLPHPDNTLA